MNTSFFQELLSGVAERGRALIDLSIGGHHADSIEELSRALMSSRGEAAGVALAQRILDAYAALSHEERLAYFQFLNTAFTPDPESVREAARSYLEAQDDASLRALTRSVEPPMQEFLRRLNMAPGATAQIVAMRTDLLDFIKTPGTETVDENFRHLLGSWFNRGFLVLQRIDWSTPANILEKIIQYEAVHQIKDWSDLRRRLDPRDRRCYAFFHPSLIDEPLIFVQIALTSEIPGSIQDLLSEESKMNGEPEPSTAVFYSISNCQKGLSGISFGNFLIKQVAGDLQKEIPRCAPSSRCRRCPASAAGWSARARATSSTT